MRQILRFAALVPVFVAILPLLAAPPVPDDKPDEEKMRAKLLAGGTLSGKLTGIELDKAEKLITVQVMWTVKTPNKDGQKKLADVVRRYNEALRAKDRNRAKQIYDEGVAASAAAWDVQETPLEFQCKPGEDLKVRKRDLPPKEPGADGKVRPYTAKEYAEFKGPDAKLPGYNATIKDLELEQYVTVYLDKTKFKAPTPTKSTGKDEPKDTKKDGEKKDAKEKDKDAKGDAETVVYPINIIMIVPPPQTPGGGGGVNPFTGK